jgi:DNA polymerase III alpha subunit
MNQNKFGELIFAETDVIDLIMKGHSASMFDGMIVDDSVLPDRWPDFLNNVPNFQQQRVYNCSVPEWHAQQQASWHIPDEYKNMDIEQFLVDQCPKQNYERLVDELVLFRQYNMIAVLKYCKYLVDTMRKHNIIWGVGRGSSVASYVLYLIGIHKIDSIKYNLDIREFLK